MDFGGAVLSEKSIQGLRKEPLPKTIRDPHVTFAYMPRTVDETLFGEEMAIKMIGYGNDGRNEGGKFGGFIECGSVITSRCRGMG